jgi:hypothetical protein
MKLIERPLALRAIPCIREQHTTQVPEKRFDLRQDNSSDGRWSLAKATRPCQGVNVKCFSAHPSLILSFLARLSIEKIKADRSWSLVLVLGQ